MRRKAKDLAIVLGISVIIILMLFFMYHASYERYSSEIDQIENEARE